MKKVFGRPGLLPPQIDINKVNRVMDVAAGTMIWTLELANMPQVRSRLRPLSKAKHSAWIPTFKSISPETSDDSDSESYLDEASNNIELFACDLSTAKFPSKEFTDSFEAVFNEEYGDGTVMSAP